MSIVSVVDGIELVGTVGPSDIERTVDLRGIEMAPTVRSRVTALASPRHGR